MHRAAEVITTVKEIKRENKKGNGGMLLLAALLAAAVIIIGIYGYLRFYDSGSSTSSYSYKDGQELEPEVAELLEPRTGANPDEIIRKIRAEDYSPEYSSSDRKSLKAAENMFFPDGLDFVHKVKSTDGNMIYVYGGGQKTLHVYRNGGFTYIEEADRADSEEQDFYESLSTGIKYIKSHGGWLAGDDLKFQLANYGALGGGSGLDAGYRFEFDELADGIRVESRGGRPLMSIEVRGGNVTRYHRNLPDLEDPVRPGAGESRQVR